MNSRQRFHEAMRFGRPDRVPYFEEGMREGVIETWHRQGLPHDVELSKLFSYDKREDLEPDLDPRPPFKRWPTDSHDLGKINRRLNPDASARLPEPWHERVKAWKNRDHILILWVHRGLFISLGVHDWQRFSDVIYSLVENTQFVHQVMALRGHFSARLAEKVLREVEVDAALFVEPVAGNDGPLISPKMYEEFALRHYEPALDVLRQHGVGTIIYLTFGNPRILLPSILRRGFNCLWASETNMEAMDYGDIRREFGRDLRLIGGIDLDAIRSGEEAIRREIEGKVPPLLEQGGYIPLADGRVREDIPYANYVYYRRLLEKVTTR
jgi:hypothetical protein